MKRLPFLFGLLSFSLVCPSAYAQKIAVVTGANRGIGFALTLHLLKDGLNVIAVARNSDNLETLKETFPNLEVVKADLGNSEGQKAVATAVGDTRRVDYLVHNAGIITPFGQTALLGSTHQELRNLLEVNLIAPILITQGLARNLSAGSRVLLISSKVADGAVPGLGPYSISKAALDRYTDSLHKDKPNGILAASVSPGDVDTDMTSQFIDSSISELLGGAFFKERRNKLTSPDTVARYLEWLLIKTNDSDFSGKKHDIYTDDFSWNDGVPIEAPFDIWKKGGPSPSVSHSLN